MKKTSTGLFKKVPTIKDRQVRIELGRAHLLVALLAAALVMTLAVSLQPGYVPNHTLTLVAIILLIIVGLFSLAVAIALYSRKK